MMARCDLLVALPLCLLAVNALFGLLTFHPCPGDEIPPVGPVTQLLCLQVNTGSWAMGTTPALTGPSAWNTWWQRGCGHRRWCAGPGTPTCASWSSEGHEAVPRPSLCACSKGRQRRALLLPHRAALGPWRSGRGWADTMGGFPPPGPQLRPRSCAAASGSWGCTSDKDRAGLHGFIKSLFVTAAVVLHVAYTYRCPAAPAPMGTGKVYRKKAGAGEPGPALSPPSWPPG